MKEYQMSKGWRIFIYLTAPLQIALFGWVLVLPFQNRNFSPNTSWILIPVSISMITLMIVVVLDTRKGRLIIQNDKIEQIGIFSKIELYIDEIKGYIISGQYIIVEPEIRQKKRIRISKFIDGYDDILLWLLQNFPDLEKQAKIEEMQNILNNINYGRTEEERRQRLLKAKQVSKIINRVTGLASVWVFLYPKPYQYSILTAMVIPVIAVFAVKLSGGLIRIDEKKGSIYPSVIYAFIFPSLGIMLRALLDYNIYNYSNVWLLSTIIAVSFLFFLLSGQKEITFKKKSNYITVLSLVLFLFAYGFGTVIHINCYYDNSEPQCYTSKVLDKIVDSGKHTSYYLKLSSWGPEKEIDEVSVGKKLFRKIEIGNEVNIYFRSGKFGIPWFIIVDG